MAESYDFNFFSPKIKHDFQVQSYHSSLSTGNLTPIKSFQRYILFTPKNMHLKMLRF